MDETRKVTDDNISTQVQSKVNIQDNTEAFQGLSIDTSIGDKQQKKTQNDLKLYKLLIDNSSDKGNEIARKIGRENEISEIEQLMEINEKIDKDNTKILSVQRGLLSIDLDEDHHTLRERNDPTGAYYLFDSLALKKRNITLRVGYLIIK